MHKIAHGIVPVMLTPFTADDEIDWNGLERLVEWYIESGADALFAVCQSSEMQKLSLVERTALSKRVVSLAGGRLPVIASGHISEHPDDQRAELIAMADTGIDALVLVTNRLDTDNNGTEAFRRGLDAVLGWLPKNLPLGLYECPAPYRRLLTDDEFKLCRDTGRFVTLKDVSCDLETVERRVKLSDESGFAIVNANAAIAAAAMRKGSKGFAGVFTNIHPDLYAWLYCHAAEESDLRHDLEIFLALAATAESMGYPGFAKVYHTRLGTFSSAHSRVTDYDIAERHWAVISLLDHIHAGTERFRQRIMESA
ncbi:dihydrodipicolinate synthase family protein [Mesorhizobium sp. M4A.F.Ca.ET.050.02.1.1]|uniref:dihydrodipicolinate synthase family protein n=1 Tax=Mesorhizobium sp. M4A.F.Ca.ET.050.02.1.1 TaxID=2496754 RepID=UPI000FCC7314|nr:dihydrodipicolinate synthase family protein [Mesorhizobium sp. M4A.F.Ca.ET.050.02.1.1]RUX48325.1 dihydrodipicolinate synthase family protein [Mesorhizobium sp. M4A.F.Ca.ET.050.02.1.1]